MPELEEPGYGYGGVGAAGLGYGNEWSWAAGVGYGNGGLGGYGGVSAMEAFILAALAVAAFASLHHEPFKFGYSVKDKHGEQHREEVGDGKNVKGSYGFTDARGIHRQVNYVADHAGFRAQVKTNEPGTANQNPAAVHIISNAPYGHGGYAGAAGLGYAGAAGIGYAGVGTAGLGYGYGGLGAAGVGYGNVGLGTYGGLGYGGNGLLGGLGYARYGY
ncbi:hypothetical protein AVEN_25867-1 [Araneus ventricosus]|uniref:Cuticle protein 16.8 n=1 Tax=Araneus ventricosus TaxID=182803 RepID=A0A4Y2T4R9_ARAVE|nr:hypothetical protein AVEN_25867-1 [Araneus ventricosus]